MASIACGKLKLRFSWSLGVFRGHNLGFSASVPAQPD